MDDNTAFEVRFVDLVFPRQTNHYGTMFAGDQLSALAKVAFVTASRYTRARMVLRRTEQVDFKAPVPQGRLVELIGRVVEESDYGVVVDAELVAEDLLSGERTRCVTGRFDMTAVDEAGKATKLAGRG